MAQQIIIAKIIDEGIVLKDFHVIFLWGCMLIGIASLAFLCGIVNTYFAAHAAQSFALDLRNALFSEKFNHSP